MECCLKICEQVANSSQKIRRSGKMTTLGGPPAAAKEPAPASTLPQEDDQLRIEQREAYKERKKQKRKNKSKNPKTITIDRETYEIVEKLGQGAYGTVQKVKDDEGFPFAVKRVEFNPLHGVYADVIKEMDILTRFAGHPNIIALYGYAWREKEFIVLMEYGGTPLHRYIDDVSYDERMELLPMVMWQILSALQYLHSCGICHRDIKPDNILVEEFEVDGELIPHLRLCDFGLSKNMALKRNTARTSTLWYRAPENLQKLERYTYKIDVWAAGCLLYEYVTGHVMFETQLTEREERQVEKNPDKFQDRYDNSKMCLLNILSSPQFQPISEQTYRRLNINRDKLPKRRRRHVLKRIADAGVERLLYRMLTINPDLRPTAEQLLQDEYFTQIEHNVTRIAKAKAFIEEERATRAELQPYLVEHPKLPSPGYTDDIRKALVMWLLEIQILDKDKTHPQTVFLGIELFDDVMTKWGEIENNADLKYIALSCLSIASKYLEIGLDFDEIYEWNHKKFYESQGTPRSKIPPVTDKQIDDYIEELNIYEQRCLMLIDFRVGGRITALDKCSGNYAAAVKMTQAKSI